MTFAGVTACGASGARTPTAGSSPHSPATATGLDTTLFSFRGFSLTIPSDWHRTTSVNDDGSAYLTAASSPVSAGDGALGIASQENLGRDDILISITELKAPDPEGFQPISAGPHVDAAQVGDYATPAPALIDQPYTMNGRYFQIGVAFGRRPPTSVQIAIANQVLASLTAAATP